MGGGADYAELYDARSNTLKFVPVLFSADGTEFVPGPMRGFNHSYAPCALFAIAASPKKVSASFRNRIRFYAKRRRSAMTDATCAEGIDRIIS